MRSLFTLPSELLDKIYESILEQGSPAPTSPLDNDGRKHLAAFNHGEDCDELVRMNMMIRFHKYIVLPYAYRQVLALKQAAPLELGWEIEEATSRVVSRGNIYKLDIMIDQKRLYPTWTLVTTAMEHIDRLEVDFRFFNEHQAYFDDDSEGESAEGIFDSEGQLMDGLLALLQRFLLSGPNVWRHQSRNYSIGTLALNITTKGRCVDAELVRRWTRLEVPQTGIVTGEWLREAVIAEMRSRLQHHALDCGDWILTLQKRIRAVELRIDGKDPVNVPLVE